MQVMENPAGILGCAHTQQSPECCPANAAQDAQPHHLIPGGMYILWPLMGEKLETWSVYVDLRGWGRFESWPELSLPCPFLSGALNVAGQAISIHPAVPKPDGLWLCRLIH